MDAQQIIRDLEAQAKADSKSVGDICQELGIHRATWQRLKAGRCNPSFDTLKALLAAQEQIAEPHP